MSMNPPRRNALHGDAPTRVAPALRAMLRFRLPRVTERGAV